jgi:hypothetical protein
MSTDQRPAETAAYQYREAAAAAVVSQLTAATSEHTKAMMAGTDRTDQRVTPMDLPPVPGATSKHTGPPTA